ncbi:MAG: response regulator [Magnetococcales bacterium]|nr:response regulator [Magnetococcales bacterium]
MAPLELTGEARRLAGEILTHAERLVAPLVTNTHRDHLLQIRQAVDTLLALLETTETLSAPPAPQVGMAPPEANRTGNHHVLLVEDNPFTQKLMTRLLTQQGYRVTLAQNGQEALDQLARLPALDLILMDLRMPVMDGFQTTVEIRQRESQLQTARLPIIAVTALVAEEEQKRAMDAGMDGYHIKPVRAAILFAEMERLLQGRPDSASAAVETSDVKMIVDLDRLLKTVDGDLELLKEITELYFTDAPRQLARITRALEAGDSQELREAAHSLKGATGAFGRVQVYDLALALEQAGAHAELGQAEDLYRQLTAALQVMEEAIKKEITLLSGESS